MKNLVIIGAGGCGREVLQWARQINAAERRWNIKGFLEYDGHALEGKKCGAEICGNDDTYEIRDDDEFICAIGNGALREKAVKQLKKRGARFTNVIHPTAIVADTARLGDGVILYPFTVVSDHAVIEDGVIVNSHTSIAHDSHLEEYCTLSAHCDVTGMCTLGKRVFMGTSSNVIPGSVIGMMFLSAREVP